MRGVAFILLLVAWAGSASGETNALRVFGLAPGVLPEVKARAATNDATLLRAFRKLTNDAMRALAAKAPSVMDKPRPGASGDKHDYFSQAPYFWPNTNTPNGLPYIRRDGRRNPESGGEHSDAPRMAQMAENAHTLALTYYFTGQERYAEHAARFLRVWFLDSATRMNPNFQQAQAIPGVNHGRGIGIIESRSLMKVCDAVGLLAGSTNWSRADDAGMQQWVGEFLAWLQTSKNGRDEQAAKNNHGSWYDAQVAHFALFIGDTKLARRVIESAKEQRIVKQILPDGQQPLETAREDSFGYSRFNLQALFTLANLGDHAGVDLWRYETTDGASLRRALDYLIDFVEAPEKQWPFERGKIERRTLDWLVRKAAAVYQDERYSRALPRNGDSESDREVLLIPIP